MPKRFSVLLKLPPELVAAIDAKRGEEPRTQWITRVLAAQFSEPAKVRTAPVASAPPKRRDVTPTFKSGS
jgi:hypothetical protein